MCDSPIMFARSEVHVWKTKSGFLVLSGSSKPVRSATVSSVRDELEAIYNELGALGRTEFRRTGGCRSRGRFTQTIWVPVLCNESGPLSFINHQRCFVPAKPGAPAAILALA
jgi:hypothetical protein